jgi:hypothetical protein
MAKFANVSRFAREEGQKIVRYRSVTSASWANQDL